MSQRTSGQGASGAPPTVLIVDGDASERRMLSHIIRAQGWRVVETAHGQRVTDIVKKEPPDLILLDAVLPDADGFSLCRSLREFSSIPIIIVTYRKAESDRVAGLASGADDYVVKPYSPAELVARMRAVLKRSGGTRGKQ